MYVEFRRNTEAVKILDIVMPENIICYVLQLHASQRHVLEYFCIKLWNTIAINSVPRGHACLDRFHVIFGQLLDRRLAVHTCLVCRV